MYSTFRILNEALGYWFGHQRRKHIKQKTKFEKEKKDLTGELEKQNQNNKDIYETIKYLILITRGIFLEIDRIEKLEINIINLIYNFGN